MTATTQHFLQRHRRALALGGAAVLLAGGSSLLFGFIGREGGAADPGPTMTAAAARPVHTFTIRAYADKREATYLGRVRAPVEIDLAFEVGGRLDTLEVATGTRVTAGTPLARLDATQYQLALDAAEERLTYAVKELERTRRLAATGSAATAELDRAVNAESLARIARDQARENLDDTILRAPYDGRVAARKVERGSFVRPGEPILVFQAAETSEVDFYQTESQLERLLDGLSNGEISVTIADGPAAGTRLALKDYATAPNPRTGAYRVTMRVASETEATAELLPGTPVRIRIEERLPEHAGVVRIPADAVTGDAASGQRVWVLPEGSDRPQPRRVVVGRVAADFVEIVAGLRPGDRVITAGASLLRPHMRVKPLQDS